MKPPRLRPGSRPPSPAAALRTDALSELRRLERLADLMDSRFRIPGTGIRIGLDPLIGLIPGIGDSATLLVSCYLVSRAARMGVPGRVVGDVFDIGFRANRRNIDLLEGIFIQSEPLDRRQ